MSDIKTVTLDGTELRVEGLHGQNTAIVNQGSSTIYVSVNPNIEPDKDNVAAIPAGGAMNLYDTYGTVYLFGTGKVQLRGTDYNVLPVSETASGGGGGSTGSGVSQEYVDNADMLALQSAKKYTDNKISEVENNITASATGTLNNANEYTDSVKSEITDSIAETAGYVLDRANAHSDAAVSALDTHVTANENAISTLNGTGEGSVTKTVTDKVAEIVANAPEDFDTLKEISDWISNHSESAAAMNSAINGNTAEIETVKTELSEKADISDIPTSLPADGGNAETAERLATARAINGVAFDGSKDIEIDAVTVNTYNCNFSTSLAKLLVEVDMSAETNGSYSIMLDGFSEQSRTPACAAYFQIILNLTGTMSNNFDIKGLCTDVTKMPVLKYTVDLNTRIFRLYVVAPGYAFDFNYRVAVQSMRNISMTDQNIIRNTPVIDMPSDAIDLVMEQYASLSDISNIEEQITNIQLALCELYENMEV